MNSDTVPPPTVDPAEVTSLIATLHRTEKRLDKLTGGEVDTVADGEGHTLVMRHAQEHLRASEAEKQAAIIDALPAHIALLDAQGTIVSVNEAWRRFPLAGDCQTPGHGVGVNYLEACRSAGGGDESVAARVATGVHAVMEGTADSFSIEYSCHSPAQEGWFEMTVTPLADAAPRGAVVMHVNSTERRRGEEQSLRFVAAMDSVADAIYLIDRASMRLVHVNDAACRMQGMTRDQLLARGPGGLLGVSIAKLEVAYDAAIASGEDPPAVESLRTLADGSQAWIEVRRHAHRMGERWTIITLARDITTRRKASEELRASESLKGAILAASLDCVVTLDHHGAITEFNPAAEATFGRTREYALGRDMVDMIVPPRYREAHRQGFAKYLATGKGAMLNKRIEIDALRADGSEFPIEIAITAIGGATPRFAGFIRDISTRRQTERKLKRLHRVEAVVSRINSLIVGRPARDALLEEACRIAVGEGGLRMAWIGIANNEGMIRPAAWAGEVGDFFTSAPPAITESMPGGFGIAGRAMSQARPMVSNDLEGDPAIIMRARFEARDIHSLAVIPLIVGGKATGVLSLYSSETAFFTDEEMPLLREMAGNISLALERMDEARKLERMTRVNAMLSGINGAILRIRDRQELLDEACRIAVETGNLPFAWIGMADPAGRECRPAASAGADQGYFALFSDRLSLVDNAPGGYGLSARAIREGRALVVHDVEADASIKYRAELCARGVRSMAALPFTIDGKAVGAFVLYASEAGFFDGAETQLLGEVAGNIAFALDHIQKEERLRRLTRVYAVLSGINSLIVRVTDRDQLFREATRIACEDGGFRMAWIAVIDKSSGQLMPVASAGDVRDFFQASHLGLAHNRPGGKGLPGRCVREMKPMISNDIRDDPAILRKAMLLDRGVRSAAHIPLIVGGVSIGSLALYSSEVGFFDGEEIRLLQTLADDLGHAIDHIDKKERLDYLAYYDALTGLPNRTLFLGRVAQGMPKAVVGGRKLALVLIDLERFKSINDTLGRAAGDMLLQQVAKWLTRLVGDAELVGHIGADRFAVLIPEVRREGTLERLLDRAIKSFLDHAFQLGDGTYRVAGKVGVAVFPRDGTTPDMLFKHAEAALKKAKASGDRVLFYKPTMTALVAGKLTLENQLRDALNLGEFVLHYQPKVALDTGKLVGAEALIRWNDPRTGLVPPGRFIPVLEETGLIEEVGRWALRKALGEYLRWRTAGLPAVRIAVNVSPLQLRSPGFVAAIRQAIAIGPDAAAGLELEITESLIMEDVKHSIATLQAVRDMGVRIAIDDFGTGFSSLSYLAKLPVDTVKIDRSFVVDMTVGPEGLALVSTIINLAHSLKLNVVAEGVETAEQSRLLRLLDCDEMQGFLFSKAIPGDAFEAAFLTAAPPA